jgi:hypothetical protein
MSVEYGIGSFMQGLAGGANLAQQMQDRALLDRFLQQQQQGVTPATATPPADSTPRAAE